MATNRLEIAELDFDSIKQNLKSFLKQQSQFSDYDFEGSGFSVLLDILAYNTHYNAYYLNMVANESFLDSAILRDSVNARVTTIYEGTSEIQQLMQAGIALGYRTDGALRCELPAFDAAAWQTER